MPGARLLRLVAPHAGRTQPDESLALGLEGRHPLVALETECERLVGLGATRVRRYEAEQAGSGHIVMQDPEGNEFCLD